MKEGLCQWITVSEITLSKYHQTTDCLILHNCKSNLPDTYLQHLLIHETTVLNTDGSPFLKITIDTSKLSEDCTDVELNIYELSKSTRIPTLTSIAYFSSLTQESEWKINRILIQCFIRDGKVCGNSVIRTFKNLGAKEVIVFDT